MTMLNQGSVLNKQSIICFLSLLCIVIYCDDKDCWLKFDAKEHFEVMDEIDDRYTEVRENFQKEVGGIKFDKEMLVVMLKTRGMAERALHNVEGDEKMIPAGINLGGHCMMRIPKSLLFFHRMKLRNNTRFRILNLESNLTTLDLKADLHLNDLHLFGSYDISHTTQDNSLLLFYPSFGEVEFLLKNVSYKIEGRYRLLHNRLNIELVTSEILMDDILMMYQNQSSTNTLKLDTNNIESFVDRLKVDLDKWIKDYFNDYLTYFVIAEDSEFEKYNQEKTTALNNYADKVINIIKQKINDIQAHAVQLPKFNIQTKNGVEIQLRNGALRGLDSMYRRSITTGSKNNNIRKVDTVVGFSNLKLTYRYDTIPQPGVPPVTGVLTLIADDLTAHLALALIKSPESADLSFKFLEQTKPESLTVEGSANRMISNFKYVLERHVIGIMMNSLMHNINMLGTLDRCVPIFAAFKESEDTRSDTDYSLESKNKINVIENSDKSNEGLNENLNANINLANSANIETEAVSKVQESQQQTQEEPLVQSEHPEDLEQEVSKVQESQQLTQEEPLVQSEHPEGEEPEANKVQDSQQETQENTKVHFEHPEVEEQRVTSVQDGPIENLEQPEVAEAEVSQEPENQQQSQEGDIVKETADNTLNSDNDDNKKLIGNMDNNNTKKMKKFKHLRRNPKKTKLQLKNKKVRKITVKHNNKY